MGHISRAIDAHPLEHDTEIVGNLAKMMLAANDAAAEATVAETPLHRVNRLGAELARALDEYGSGNVRALVQPASKSALPIGFITSDLYPDSHPDAALLALGEEFSDRIAFYREASERASEVIDVFDDWAASAGLPVGTREWLDRRTADCDGAITAQNNAASAVDVVADAIRFSQAATAAGLSVKAKILPFDLGKYADETMPMRDWDWDIECLHRFIAEVQRFAVANSAV